MILLCFFRPRGIQTVYKMCRGRGQAGFMPFSRRQGVRLRGAEAAKGGSVVGAIEKKDKNGLPRERKGRRLYVGSGTVGKTGSGRGTTTGRLCCRCFLRGSGQGCRGGAAFQEGLRDIKKEPPAGGSHNMKYVPVPCTILTHTVYRRGGGGGGCRSWYPEKCEGAEARVCLRSPGRQKTAGRKRA